MKAFKQKVIEAIRLELTQRLQIAVEHRDDLIDSRNNDTKSSAGDKYETSREMVQQEIDQVERQIYQNKLMLSELQRVSTQQNISKIGVGSLVEKDNDFFLLGVGFGKIIIDGKTVYGVSAESPLGKNLNGKSEGDKFDFKGKTYWITNGKIEPC